jgi:hypothetical protein
MAMGLAHGPAWAAPNPAAGTPPVRGATPAPPARSATAAPPARGATPATPPAPATSPQKAPAAAAPAPAARGTAPATKPAKPAAATSKADDKPAGQVKKARDLWYRGVDAFRAGNYEEARRAFAECYQLMPKSDVLRNLSISEIQSGHYVSAARHLKQLLSSAPGDLPSNVREEANSRLAQAEAQIGQLKISVDIAGAEISIDGTVIGRSPLEGSWYIEPGQHEIIVSKAGYPAESRQVFALAGVAIPIDVSLETLRREQAADAKAAELMGTSEGQSQAARETGIGTGSTVLLATTGTLAAASLAAGIYFTESANGHDSDAEGLSQRMPGTGACNPDTTDLPDDCRSFIQSRQDSVDDRNRAMVGFIGFGVASALTLGYALWLTLDSDESVPETAKGVEPFVSIGRGTASIHLHGRF